jgi:hypothetical protein
MTVDDLPDAEVNPKNHDIHAIARSIKKFGVAETAVLDERTGRVLHGHGRRDALRLLRDTTTKIPDGVEVRADGTWLIPVLRGWESADDDHAHATALALNRHTEQGGWDETELAGVLDQLNNVDPDLPLTAGFDSNALDDLLARLEESGPLELPTYQPDNESGGNVRTEKTLDEQHANYELSTQRSIVLAYSGARYVWVVDMLSALAAKYAVETNAEVVLKLIEHATNEHAPDAE